LTEGLSNHRHEKSLLPAKLAIEELDKRKPLVPLRIDEVQFR